MCPASVGAFAALPPDDRRVRIRGKLSQADPVKWIDRSANA